jgi:hypothetical protein
MSGRTNWSGSIAGPMTVDTVAQLSPGASGVGVLTTGDTILSAGSGLVIDLDPTNGENDALNVRGTVALNGADLVLDLLSAPTRGEAFDILTNDGTDPISGQFSEGSQVTGMFDGQAYSFRIDYAFNADGGSVGDRHPFDGGSRTRDVAFDGPWRPHRVGRAAPSARDGVTATR